VTPLIEGLLRRARLLVDDPAVTATPPG